MSCGKQRQSTYGWEGREIGADEGDWVAMVGFLGRWGGLEGLDQVGMMKLGFCEIFLKEPGKCSFNSETCSFSFSFSFSCLQP